MANVAGKEMNKKRKAIWDKTGGKCWYCGCDLPEKGWHADHVEPIVRVSDIDGTFLRVDNPGRDIDENKVPACAPCNMYKATYSVEQFREELQKQVDRARKSSVNFRNAERYGLVTVNEPKVVFYFEREGLFNG